MASAPIIIGAFVLVALTVIAVMYVRAQTERAELDHELRMLRERHDYDEIVAHLEAEERKRKLELDDERE